MLIKFLVCFVICIIIIYIFTNINLKTMKNQKKKIQVSKEFYDEVESTTMLLHKLNYPLDLLDDLYKTNLK